MDLWYSDITPDKEAPELIRSIIMDVLGEISGRIKEVNIVDLLTRDVVDLVGDHLDLFRKNQAAIGVDVMGILSSEERDERLKYHLLASNELHPALISPDCEYKVLQRLMGGLLAVVLRPREAQSPLVRCIARELLTCLVMQPVMNFASPGYINELIEYIFLANKEDGADGYPDVEAHKHDHTGDAEHMKGSKSDFRKDVPSDNQTTNRTSCHSDGLEAPVSNTIQDESIQFPSADWARILEATTQRRTEVLTPENLENMWTKGRNYKKKLNKKAASGIQSPTVKHSRNDELVSKRTGKDVPARETESSTKVDNKALIQLPPRPLQERISEATLTSSSFPSDELVYSGSFPSNDINRVLKRSSSTSDLTIQLKAEGMFDGNGGGAIISEFYSADLSKVNDVQRTKRTTDTILRIEGQQSPKLRCRVLGAYFEKLGSKSFAVYSIAITDANNNTWFVKRRYRNFERLHRQLKDIPNYTLHLPPKRIFSSSTEDTFVHQRCIRLDKYLQDLLSIANVAEQHEVWDFLSVSSKNYSFGKSSSVMRTLAVNVDDAMDDIVRQFKGVSDGLMRKVVGSPNSSHDAQSVPVRNLSWNAGEMNKLALTLSASESANSLSDDEDGNKDLNRGLEESECNEQSSGWHSDNELNSKGFPPRVIKRDEESQRIISEDRGGSANRLLILSPEASLMLKSENLEDPIVPPEWTPNNLSLPILKLVDNIFQLKRRGWLRRQVFWISRQILQLMMEDAIDDWLLRQIHFLRREDVIVHVVRWIQDVLWPGGIFFLRLRAINASQSNMESGPTQRQAGSKDTKTGSFEEQLEAARRASDVKKMIFNGAPTTLVSLIGHKQYRRSAKDIYYFLQSPTCLKQLAYGILELLLISLFPELRDLVTDIHEKSRAQPV
ncbi:hypothetical protein Leryth_011571 [Lithospermum erythrorhizon]|nr:hypothetical protein Leryth_011571 [Lithospermum erythrorhizon]